MKTKSKKSKNKVIKRASPFSKSHLIIFALIFMVIGGWFLYRSFAAPAPLLYVTPSTTSVGPTTAVTFQIRENSGSKSVNAVQANLSYPTGLFKSGTISSTNSPFKIAAESSVASGSIKIGRGAVGGVAGDQLVATVTLIPTGIGGTGNVAFGAGTALIDSTINSNLVTSLTNTAGASYTVNAKAPLYLSSSAMNVGGSTEFVVEVRENSGSTAVNTVQANLVYPSAYLDFVKIDSSKSAFNISAQATGGVGKVNIARGATGTGVAGDQLVSYVYFRSKTIGGPANISFASGSNLIEATTSTGLVVSPSSLGELTVNIAGNPALYLSPGTQTVSNSNTIAVAVRENSGSTAVNTVQANLSYSATNLDFVSISAVGSPFNVTAQSSGGSGSVSIARGATGSGVAGDQLVAIVYFKPKNVSGPTSISFANGSSLLTSSLNENIIPSLGATGSATITVNLPPPPAPEPTSTSVVCDGVWRDLNDDGTRDYTDTQLYVDACGEMPDIR